jgi:hypothetical protein
MLLSLVIYLLDSFSVGEFSHPLTSFPTMREGEKQTDTPPISSLLLRGCFKNYRHIRLAAGT